MRVDGVPVIGQADCPFKIGDKVRLKKPGPGISPDQVTGIVAYVPDGPLTAFPGRILGKQMRVTLPSGSSMIVDYDDCLAVP